MFLHVSSTGLQGSGGKIFFLHGYIPCTLKNPIKKVTLATVRREHTVRRVYTQRNTEREII